MKIKKLSLLLATVLTVSIIFVGCEKEELTNPKNLEFENEFVSPQYLEFENFEEFQKVLFDENFDVKENFPDFISMYDVLDEISTTNDEVLYKKMIGKYSNILVFDDDKTPHLLLGDNNLCRLLTPSGLVKVGNNIFYIDKDYLKVISENNFDILTIQAANETTDDIIVYEIDSYKASSDKTFYSSNGLYKLYVVKFYRNYGLWATIGADATHYQKDGSDWFKSKTRIDLEINWDSFYYELYWPWGFIEKVTGNDGSKDKTDRAKSLHLSYNSWWYAGLQHPTVHSYSVTGLKATVSTPNTGVSGTF